MRVVALLGEVEQPPVLADVPLLPFISEKGRVMPQVLDRAAATVFAVFNEDKEIQYVGFSKDIRNTLRTVLGRQPDLCHYFKTWDLDSVDQKRMLKCRQEWIKEAGQPKGQSTSEAQMWQASAEQSSVAAATELAKSTLDKLRARGLKESFVADPAQLKKRVFEVLASDLKTDKELDSDEIRLQMIEKNTYSVSIPVEDVEYNFTIFFSNKIATNGGHMFDVSIFCNDKESRHRIICGKNWPASTGLEPEEVVKAAFAFLLHKRVERHTEGLLISNQFPINYFSMSEVEQWFPDFGDLFNKKTPESYWRFDIQHTYGYGAAADMKTKGLPPSMLELEDIGFVNDEEKEEEGEALAA